MYQFVTLGIVALAASLGAVWHSAHALTPGEIYERSRAAVVKIRVHCAGEKGGTGSGFVVAEKGGAALIVTNHHVAYACKETSQSKLEVAFDDRTTLPATRIGGDHLSDVALISVPRKNVKPLAFAGTALGQRGRNQPIKPIAADGAAVGFEIVAIGYPLDLDVQPTVTRGIISAVGRNLGDKSEVLQFDAAIDRGSSGGPLLNSNGQVIGVVFGGAPSGKNLGYAMPHTIAKVVVGDLMTTGQVRRNSLGASEGLSILEAQKASFRERGAPIREGLLLMLHEAASPARRPDGERSRLSNELARCDLVQKFAWIRGEEDLAAECGPSKACRVIQPERSIDIRSIGDWHNAMLWIPEGTRARINYVRYPQSKCDVIGGLVSDVQASQTPAQAAKLKELIQSEGAPGSVTVILGPRSRYVPEGPRK